MKSSYTGHLIPIKQSGAGFLVTEYEGNSNRIYYLFEKC